MRNKPYAEDQILAILREIEQGLPVAEASRRYGISETTVYRWRERYSGCDTECLRRIKELEAENARLKRIVAHQALEIDQLTERLQQAD